MMPKRRFAFGLIAVVASLAQMVSSRGEPVYPDRMVRIVVPVPPGPTADTLPRLIAGRLAAMWGQSVIIENRPGAALNLAAGTVFKAPPDGYTLLATPAPPLAINQFVYAKLAYDPAAFVPITVLAEAANVLVAGPSLPVASVQELIAYAASHPGRLTYASSGVGSTSHLAMEALKALTGIEATHVPYNALGPALADLLGGHVDLLFDNLGNVAGPIRDGRIRALAVGHPSRLDLLPNTPALAERYPGFVSNTWFAMVAPPATPGDIAIKVSTAVAGVLREREMVDRMRDLFLTPVGNTPQEAARFMEVERARWRDIVSTAGIKVDE